MAVIIQGINFDDIMKELKKLRVDVDHLERKVAAQQDEIAELKKDRKE